MFQVLFRPNIRVGAVLLGGAMMAYPMVGIAQEMATPTPAPAPAAMEMSEPVAQAMVETIPENWTPGEGLIPASAGEGTPLGLIAGSRPGEYILEGTEQTIRIRILQPGSGRTYPVLFAGMQGGQHRYEGAAAVIGVSAPDPETFLIEYKVADNLRALALLEYQDGLNGTTATFSQADNGTLFIETAEGRIHLRAVASRTLRTRSENGFELASMLELESPVRVVISRRELSAEAVRAFETGLLLEPLPEERRQPAPTPVVRVRPVPTSPQPSS